MSGIICLPLTCSKKTMKMIAAKEDALNRTKLSIPVSIFVSVGTYEEMSGIIIATEID